MLKLFRKKIVSKIILWGLLILILPAFVMWGSAGVSRSKDKGPDYAGIINDKKVSFDDLARALSGVRTQIILNYFNQPKVLEAVLSNKPVLAKLAWDRLLMLNEAKKMSIKVSDKEVIDAIRTHPLFIRDNVFDDRFYGYVLRNNLGLEPRVFEESVREDLMLRKLTLTFTKGLKIPDEDVRSEYNKELGKFKLAYVMIEPKDAAEEVTVDEKTAKDFYEKHKNDLVVKSTLKGALPDRTATFDEAREAIEKYIKESSATQSVKEKAEETYKKIDERMRDKNETFQKAASGRGLDVKETDFFSRNDKLGEIGDTALVADAAAALKEFQVSEPVNTTKGFIIFEVIDKKPADEEAFKKDKDEYVKKIQEKKASMLMQDWLKKIEDDNKPVIKLDEIDKYYR